MAVEGIDIDLQYVGDMAVNIRKINTEISEELKAISNEMSRLESIWSSPAQKALNAKFNSFEERKDKFYHDLAAYADFLTETAKEYGYTETQINKNAESFE